MTNYGQLQKNPFTGNMAVVRPIRDPGFPDPAIPAERHTNPSLLLPAAILILAMAILAHALITKNWRKK